MKGKVNLSLVYKGKGRNLERYVDASLGVSEEQGKSKNGILIKLFGDIIQWKTKKQNHNYSFVCCRGRAYSNINSHCGSKNFNEICRRLIKIQLGQLYVCFLLSIVELLFWYYYKWNAWS